MLEINKVYNEDCMGEKGMCLIADKSIDLVMTDPPYNVSRKSNFHTMGRVGVGFGDWDKGFDITGWIKLCADKLKIGGSMVIFNDWKNMGYIRDELESKDVGMEVKKMIRWEKPNPMPRNRDRLYVDDCEYAIWAVKGKGWVFNRQKDTYDTGKFTYPIVHHSKRIHKTEKPIGLISDIIKTHSNPGDLVLDPFGGSCSMAISCLETGRRFIGFEWCPEQPHNQHFDPAQKRIAEYLSKEV